MLFGEGWNHNWQLIGFSPIESWLYAFPQVPQVNRLESEKQKPNVEEGRRNQKVRDIGGPRGTITYIERSGRSFAADDYCRFFCERRLAVANDAIRTEDRHTSLIAAISRRKRLPVLNVQ